MVEIIQNFQICIETNLASLCDHRIHFDFATARQNSSEAFRIDN